MVEVSAEVWESVARWLELTGLQKRCSASGSRGRSARPSPRGTRGTSLAPSGGSVRLASSRRQSSAIRATSTSPSAPAASSCCSATALRSWFAVMPPWGSWGAVAGRRLPRA